MQSMGSAHEMTHAAALAGIAIVLLAGLALGRLVRRLRQPVVIGEIAAGILLGPSVLGHLPGDLSDRLFPSEVRPLLSAVSQVGLVLFMFLVGWEFEKALIRPHVRLAAGVSLGSVALAFGLGVGAAALLHPQHATVAGREVSFAAFATFLGAAMSVTAFPVLARILNDNRLLDTRVGVIAIASAAVDDVLAWCLLAYVSALVSARGDYQDLLQIGIRSALYVAAMFLVVRPLLARLVWRLTRTRQQHAVVVLLGAGALLSAWVTTWAGIHAIFGAFLFGIVTPRQPRRLLDEHLRRPIEHLSLILLPVFFIVTGLGVDIGALTVRDTWELALILAVACTGKLLGATLVARATGMGWRESRTLGLLMNTRGLTELIILNAAASLGILDGRMFTMMVIMALATTALAGPLLPGPSQLPAVPRPATAAPTPGPTAEPLTAPEPTR